MSRRCLSGIVKFVTHNLIEASNNEFDSDQHMMLGSPYHFMEINNIDENQVDSCKIKFLSFGDWEFVPKQIKVITKKGNDLYGFLWLKGTNSVWIVNEDQYSSVGEHSLSAVSDVEENITLFLKDHNFTDYKVEKDDIVHCWV